MIFLTQTIESEGIEIVKVLGSQSNFPNCIGVMDEQHILIKQPRNSGSNFFT